MSDILPIRCIFQCYQLSNFRYEVAEVTLDEIHPIAASILKLYTRPKVKIETLEAKVEEIRKQQQEARLKNKLQPQQTPVSISSIDCVL